MTRVVMEKQELVHIRVKLQRNHAAERTMAPADVLRVLLLRILGIQDREIAALKKPNHFRTLGSSKISRLVLADSIARSQLQLQLFIRFIIRKERD